MKETWKAQIRMMHEFFTNSTAVLSEDDSNHSPKPEMFTVAQHVAHTAQTIDWFLDGAFSSDGFDMNWDQHMEEVRKTNSLAAAREWLDRAVNRVVETIDSHPESVFMDKIVDGPIMGGVPRLAVFSAMADHTAHHRGALTVYARQLNKTPAMPYGG